MQVVWTKHFRDRVRERLPGVDPGSLARGIWWAIENNRVDLVRYAHRHPRSDGSMFRYFDFEVENEPFRVVIHDETTKVRFITIHRNTERQCNPRTSHRSR